MTAEQQAAVDAYNARKQKEAALKEETPTQFVRTALQGLTFKTADEIDDSYRKAPLHKAFLESPFNDISIIDRETTRYLNAIDQTQEAFNAFRKTFNPDIQREFDEWKAGKTEQVIETNFTEPERKSVWEVMSGATTEDLFKFKLDIFEQEVVQNSENRELRSKIRKAKSICEVCAAYQQLLDEETGSDS